MTERLRRLSFWLLPPAFCLWVYWFGLRAWFQQDDFAWLGLRLQVHSFADFLSAMFAPMAQGSIRPWSERAFFMACSAVFGMEALPFHICIFLTQFANLALLGAITRRVTRSWLAGLAAPLLWLSNPGLAVPLSWTSSYNQVLCAFCLLGAFYCFLRYIDSERRAWYVAQWVFFVLGFGALELNVVYPALALAYALAAAPRFVRKTLPLFAVSAAYAVLHHIVAPPQVSGVYQMHWDSAVFTTFWQYWQWALAAARLPDVRPMPDWFAPAATAVLTVVLLGFALWRAWRREFLGLFCLAWFGIVLAPLLPLRDHITDYYLAIPVIGLAMLGGWSMAAAWKKSVALGAISFVIAGLYVASGLPVSRATARWYFNRGRKVQTMVAGVAFAQQLHPGKLILLNGIDSDLFWAGVYHKPFRITGGNDVYLTPGSETGITAHGEVGAIGDYLLAPAVAGRALEREEAVVYQVGGPRLKNVTSHFRDQVAPTWKKELPRFLNVGQKLFADLLGPSWYSLEGGYRWMPGEATLRMGGPVVPAERLHFTGYCAEGQLAGGPFSLTVSAGGLPVGSVEIRKAGQVDGDLAFPATLIGREEVEIALTVSRTFTPAGDSRKLGMAFGTFAIR
ncbi:MAG: hypothetical protein ABI693_10525 [Bryobacteraceae bacterium]